MELKVRLQRMLQIVEDAEREGALAPIEQDILLAELREAYAELKFGQTENGERKTENETDVAEAQAVEPAVAESVAELPIIPIAPMAEEPTESVDEEESDEPEVEVELIFNEEDEEIENSEEIEDRREEIVENGDQAVIPSECNERGNLPLTGLLGDCHEPNGSRNDENLSTSLGLSTPKRSALLSLYEDAPTPVLGEQFHDVPSVADTIACPKGVAESAPVASLREAIGLADKFMLISELFDGDVVAYERAIEALDGQLSFDDCIIYIAENYTWSPNSEATKLVMELLNRKYN